MFPNIVLGRLPEKLSLFCANTAFEHIDYVYRLLPHVKVSSNGKSLSINPGLKLYRSAQI